MTSALELEVSQALRRLAVSDTAKEVAARDPLVAGMLRAAACRYIAGEERHDALRVAESVQARGHAATIDFVGESARTTEEASRATTEFLAVCRAISDRHLPSSISLDLSHLGLMLDPGFALDSAARLAGGARRAGIEMMLSMESSDRTDAILEAHSYLGKQFENVGVTLQARLYRTDSDIARVVRHAGRVRLVKGAYEEPPATALAREDPRLRERYLELLERLLRSRHPCSVATHDSEIQDRAAALIGSLSSNDAEFETLLGLGAAELDALHARGFATREYVVYGTEWFLYVMNRISEKPERILKAVIDAATFLIPTADHQVGEA